MEEQEKKWCVYIHRNKINNKAYIGITSTSLHKRWKNGHGYTKEMQPVMAAAIAKYGWENFEHIIFAENLSEEEAKHIEILLIALFKTNCSRYYNPTYGYNVSDGGEGAAGVVRSEEFRHKLSVATKERMKNPENNPMYGKKHTDESKNKMSESQRERNLGENNPFYGKHHSEETKEKLRQIGRDRCTGELNPNYGNHWSDEMKQKIRNANHNTRRVLQFDLDGNLLCEYESLREACRITSVDRRGITKCCKHDQKTAGGFKWMFKKEYEQLLTQQTNLNNNE